MPPGLAGWLMAEQQRQSHDESNLKQLLVAQQLQGHAQQQQERQRQAQREQAYGQAIAGLGPSPTQEQLAQIAARFGSPDTVMRVQQSSLDRREAALARAAEATERVNAMKEAARQRAEDQLELAKQRGADAETLRRMQIQSAEQLQKLEISSREYLARLVAGNKQPPIVQTDDGIFERGPNGLVRLTDPETGAPLKPKATEKPITEFQGKNALYGSRAAMADRTLTSLEEKISLTGLATKEAMQNAPVIGGVLGAAANTALSADQQKVEQAQRNFVNAVLRQESGAVISQQEFDNAKKQYFPQPGDSKEVIDQKRTNRQMAISGFKRIAGPAAWADVEEQLKQSQSTAQPQVSTGNIRVPPPPPGFKPD